MPHAESAQRGPASATHGRGATVLLLCMIILTTLMVLAFTFVRVLQLRHEANINDNFDLLARQSARAGLSHATEQIMLDYINEPFTRFDGAGHAEFVPWTHPIESDYPTDPAVGAINLDHDDIPSENEMNEQLMVNYGWWVALSYGHLTSDGRGKFIEPEFYNRPLLQYSATASAPAVPVVYTQPVAALPDRSNGVFYDEKLNAIPGDPRTARAAARYRLRYAVAVMDLDGEVVVNGDQGLDYHLMNSADPTNPALDPQVARIIDHQYALPNIVDATSEHGALSFNWGSGTSGGVRAEHIFLGRGCATNVDQDADTGYTPSTFALMYRMPNVFFNFKQANPANSDPFTLNDPAENLYTFSPAGPTGKVAGDEEIPGYRGFNFKHSLTGAQFSFNNFDMSVQGTALDGANGSACTLGRYTPFGRGLTKGALGRFSGNVDTPWQVNLMTAPCEVIYGMVAGYMPPGAIASQAIIWDRYTHPAQPANILQDQSTWAPGSYSAAIIPQRDLFVAVLNPAFSSYPAPTRATPAITPDYHLPWVKTTDPAYSATRYPGPVIYNGMDGTNHWQHDALGTYLRSTIKANTYADERNLNPVIMTPMALKIGSYLNDIHDGCRWFGALWNQKAGASTGGYAGASPGATQVPWNWQLQSNGSTVAVALDPGYDPDGTLRNFDQFLFCAHKDSIWEVLGEAMAASIGVARGQWLEYPSMKANPATYFNGGPWNVATMGPKVASIKDVDALFVANLGSNFTQPNSPVPVKIWSQAGFPIVYLQSSTPAFNLAGLRTATITEVVPGSISSTSPITVNIVANGVSMPFSTSTFSASSAAPGTYSWPLLAINSGSTYTSPTAPAPLPSPNPISPGYDNTKPTYSATECSAAMEKIINDMRLSFFGSSPGYGNDFRALDLNGDGRIDCSGFVANPAATARETALHLDQYILTSDIGPSGQPKVDANGVATVPVDNYFSNTGVFMLGKSRFWRVNVRGEVWDNVMLNAVAGAQLDAVLCVDPVDGAQEFNPNAVAPDPAGGQYSTHVIFQRWFFNHYRGLLPRRQ
jgi:hypothetical protein